MPAPEFAEQSGRKGLNKGSGLFRTAHQTGNIFCHSWGVRSGIQTQATFAGPDTCLLECSDTTLNAWAPSSKVQYKNRWQMFSQWFSQHVNPVHCCVVVIPDFLHFLLDSGYSHSTLKVFAAAISCQHTQVDGVTVG